MPMAAGPLLAGFDAGQTHTTCRLARLNPWGEWRPIAAGEGSGVSHLAAPGGDERFRTALQSSLESALRQAAAGGECCRSSDLAAAAVGASGIEQESPVQARGQCVAAAALQLPPSRLVVTGDERTALVGALGPEPGVLVISGTGCIAVGRNAQGQQHRCGGWGWLLDGAGSAMDIGRDGLALSVRMADGRVPETPLRQVLWQALGVATAQEVKAAVVAPGFGPAQFARLAPLVAEAATSGDREAGRIVERSARALTGLIEGVAGALGLQAPAVCAVGGAVAHLEPLRLGLQRSLARQLPGARWQVPRGDACDGALALAAATLGPGTLRQG